MSSGSLIKQINKRFEQEGGYDEAIEVDLSGLNISSLKDTKNTLEKAKQIEVVILSENKLTSLQGLPDWKISSLNASANKLTDKSIKSIAKYTTLLQLILSNNNISSLEALAPIYQLKQLQELDLSDNPVALKSEYRATLFEKIPSLKVLDGLDKDGNEVQEQFEDLDDDDLDDDDQDDDEDDSDDDNEDESSPPKNKKK